MVVMEIIGVLGQTCMWSVGRQNLLCWYSFVSSIEQSQFVLPWWCDNSVSISDDRDQERERWKGGERERAVGLQV